MASERDFELLDEYLGNRLSAQDKAAFEQKLSTDSTLKKEYTLQQNVVEGIRKARAVELKKMLNDIPLSSIPSEGSSLLTQIGAWVVVAGLVGTGVYFYLNQDTKEPQTQTIAVEEAASADASSEESTADADQNESVVATDVPVESPSSQKEIQKTEAQKAPVVTTQPTAEETIEPAVRDVFDPNEETKNANPAVAEGNKSAVSRAPSIIVETEVNTKYSFHYQFRENKLFLYGAFEKNLYEIMEFFSDNKRTMFLFYKDSYYLLNEENEKVRPLTAITDPVLLKKLKDYRGH